MFDFMKAHGMWQPFSMQRFRLAESPRIGHGQLRWVDIEARTLHRVNLGMTPFDPANPAIQTIAMPDQIACIIPSEDPQTWIGFGRDGIWFIRDDGQHARMLPSPFDSAWQRFNDGCCDEWGRIWISTLIDDKRAPLARVYCLQGGALHPVLDGITTGNGMAYSQLHRKLWVADTKDRVIRRYDVNGTSPALNADGWFHRYNTGTERPDGACLLNDDCYVVAVIDGGRLDIFSLDMCEPVQQIHVALAKPTMPCVLPKPASGLILSSADIASANIADKARAISDNNGRLLYLPMDCEPARTHLYRFN